jgi:hypothetical protein
MADNLYRDGGAYPNGGSDERNHPDLGGAPRNPPMADREVPLEGGHPALLVQQWLDGEVTETTARRADVHDVELWQRINEEAERRRRMVTPAPVLNRIMAAIPQAAPVEPVSWWKRSLSVTNSGALLAAAALVALGVVVGALLR